MWTANQAAAPSSEEAACERLMKLLPLQPQMHRAPTPTPPQTLLAGTTEQQRMTRAGGAWRAVEGRVEVVEEGGRSVNRPPHLLQDLPQIPTSWACTAAARREVPGDDELDRTWQTSPRRSERAMTEAEPIMPGRARPSRQKRPCWQRGVHSYDTWVL